MNHNVTVKMEGFSDGGIACFALQATEQGIKNLAEGREHYVSVIPIGAVTLMVVLVPGDPSREYLAQVAREKVAWLVKKGIDQ